MNLINLKKLIPAIALVAILVVLSSCNRGMGCPTFSIDDTPVETVE